MLLRNFRTRRKIEQIVEYCAHNAVPLYVYGGGSSVTRGVEALRGGITLDMRRSFNKVISFSEQNNTITVQAGISGPQLEDALNRAPELFGAAHAYTCGHFLQSFEYSSVGGWVVTRGAGQNSTYYGNIHDLVMGQEYATPRGTIRSYGLPAHAVGPDLDEIMMGEALQDYGVVIDTMECGVTWESMERVWAGVRAFAKSRPRTICMTHLSHMYPQGANLYFIFIGQFKDKDEYLEYQSGIFDNIQALDLPDSEKRVPRFALRRWDDPAY